MICWENITDFTAASCVRCNIFMHSHCNSTWKGTKGYQECIHCRNVGSIGEVYNINYL